MPTTQLILGTNFFGTQLNEIPKIDPSNSPLIRAPIWTLSRLRFMLGALKLIEIIPRTLPVAIETKPFQGSN